MSDRPSFIGIPVAALIVLGSFGALAFASAGPTAPSHSASSGWKFSVNRMWATNASAYNWPTNRYGPTTCAKAGVPVQPTYAASSKTVHESVFTRLHVTRACRAVAVTATSEAYVEYTTPIHLSASNHSVRVNWTTAYNASIAMQTWACPKSWGCFTEADFLFYQAAYIWDNSSGIAYCSGGSPPIGPYSPSNSVCGPEVYFWASNCPGPSSYGCNMGYYPGLSLVGTMNSTVFVPSSSPCTLGNQSFPGTVSCVNPPGIPFNATHHYSLNLTVVAYATCESWGWAANAYAAVDLAKPDGSSVTAITIQ